ncbi:CCNE1 family protein [Megaselia abdita]
MDSSKGISNKNSKANKTWINKCNRTNLNSCESTSIEGDEDSSEVDYNQVFRFTSRTGEQSTLYQQTHQSSLNQKINPPSSDNSSNHSSVNKISGKRKRKYSNSSDKADSDGIQDFKPSKRQNCRSSGKFSESSSISSPVDYYSQETDSQSNESLPPRSNIKKTSFSEIGPSKTSISNICIFDDTSVCLTPSENDYRVCPLPSLSWANANDVWNLICRKDEFDSFQRNAKCLDLHTCLQPRMRAILLDWLIEVCEVYKLHRETYFLAVDYLDRFLFSRKNIQKTHLQLIGITCLFIAAKVEEIYPPKLGEFAYVTDGACTESDILHQELILLQALDWKISPVTVIGWLGVYMQLNANKKTAESFHNITKSKKDNSFIYPQFSAFEFVQTAQLLDLCSLDIGIGDYSYSVLAAAAIAHTFDRFIALNVSGLEWKLLEPCVIWMKPFFDEISEQFRPPYLLEYDESVTNSQGLGKHCSNILIDDSHIIQTHTTTMEMFVSI